jgi:hypothetical protein
MSTHQNCCCDDCVAARRRMVQAKHPILSHMHDEPLPTLIPISEALCMALEHREDLESQLRTVQADIKSLRDCAEATT